MDNWRDELPDELKGNPTLEKYESPEAALKGFIDASARLGRSITIPDEDATDERRKEFAEKILRHAPMLTFKPEDEESFWKMAGVPDDPEAYKPPEDAQLVLDEKAVDGVRELAKAANLTTKQFENLLTSVNDAAAKQADRVQELAQRDSQALEQQWGAAKAQNNEMVDALVEQFQHKDFPVLGELNTAGKLLVLNMGKAFMQDPQAFSHNTSAAGGLTPSEAREKADEIRDKLIEGGRTIPRDEQQRLLAKLTEYQRMAAGG